MRKKSRRIISLLTDFGTSDGYVGAMKGVLLSGINDAEIIDVSHNIQPFNIRQAAFSLINYAEYFPVDTIHLAVVDPGVGSLRKPLIVRTSRHYYIGPDNGIFSLIFQRESFLAYEILPEKLSANISSTFHGRDVFAPAALKLLNGDPLESYCRQTTELHSLVQPLVNKSENEIVLHVLHIDHFGNIILNFTRQDWIDMESPANIKIQLGSGFIYGIKNTFSDAVEKQVVAVWDSSGHLQIAQNMGNAAELLHMKVNDQVILSL